MALQIDADLLLTCHSKSKHNLAIAIAQVSRYFLLETKPRQTNRSQQKPISQTMQRVHTEHRVAKRTI